MERSMKTSILGDMGKKTVLISGPRQVGKTYLSKSLASKYEYFSSISQLYRTFKASRLCSSFCVRGSVRPWHRNVARAIIKEPKLIPMAWKSVTRLATWQTWI
jgi:predicted AAA+ superfamily ATPase